MSVSATSASPASSSRSFTLLDPALTTRTRMPSGTRPRPVADLGGVVADLARVAPQPQALVDHLLAEPGRTRTESRRPVDHVDDEVEAVHVVEHHHVERRRRRALLLVAAD